MQATSIGSCASTPRSGRSEPAGAQTHRDSVPRIDKEHAQWRGILFPWISSVYLGSIWGVPTVGILALMRLPTTYKFVGAILGPFLWSILFVTIAGVLSIPHQSSVRPGKIKRCISDRRYFHRRLYGLCWTAVYYNKPVYFLCLSIPLLKWLTFRLFGYRGSMNFTVYPDTWIRDLPLLHFEDGVYVSNRATLGTNIALSNGFLLVDRITLRSKSLVGHLAMLAPGVEMQHGAEVGVGGAIGIGTKIGRDASVGPRCSIGHGVLLGNRATVGGHSCVDSGSILADGTRLPVGSVVGRRTHAQKAAMRSSVGENERLAILTADEGAAI